MISEQPPFLADPVFVRALLPISTPVQCEDDRVLFKQGEECIGLYVLTRGEAVLEMCSDDDAVVCQFQAPGGSLLGLPAVLWGQPYLVTAIAFRGSQLHFVKRNDFIRLLSSDSAATLKALQIMAAMVGAVRKELFSSNNDTSPPAIVAASRVFRDGSRQLHEESRELRDQSRQLREDCAQLRAESLAIQERSEKIRAYRIDPGKFWSAQNRDE